MPPIRLTDSQITHIFSGARPLQPQDRDLFLQAVASLLAGIKDPGDGDVGRAVRLAQKQFFNPPQLTDGRAQPHNRAGTRARRRPNSLTVCRT
jgi:hypothetical protein